MTLLGETEHIEAARHTRSHVIPDDFAEVYRSHFHRVVRALELGGLSRQAAEDTAQEAFARTYSHWQRVRQGSNPPGYVYRVAFRLAKRSLKRDIPLLHEPADGADMAGDVTVRAVVEAVIGAMPPRRRACVVGCLIVGLDTRDVARSLGIAEGTVRKQLERGRSDLRAALGDSGP